MSKPRDLSGNDFIVQCAFLAELLFMAKYKRNSNPKYTHDSAKMRTLTNDIYAAIMRHWEEWDE